MSNQPRPDATDVKMEDTPDQCVPDPPPRVWGNLNSLSNEHTDPRCLMKVIDITTAMKIADAFTNGHLVGSINEKWIRWIARGITTYPHHLRTARKELKKEGVLVSIPVLFLMVLESVVKLHMSMKYIQYHTTAGHNTPFQATMTAQPVGYSIPYQLQQQSPVDIVVLVENQIKRLNERVQHAGTVHLELMRFVPFDDYQGLFPQQIMVMILEYAWDP